MLQSLTTLSIFLCRLSIISVFISGIAVANNAPITNGTIPAQTVNLGATATTVTVWTYFSDPDGDVLTYTATSSDTAIATVSVSGSVVSLTAVTQGTATITVKATDRLSLSATQTFSVTVPNRAPVASGTISDQTLDVGETFTVDPTTYFSDPDGDALTYTYYFSGTAVSIGDAPGGGVIYTAIAAGTATGKIKAADPGGLSATLSFSMTVSQSNRAPVASETIPDQTVDVGGSATTVDVSSYFTDADNDTLTYTASFSDTAKVTVSVSSATVSITAVATGTATITVTATDPGSLTATQTFSVTVVQPNRTPTAVGTVLKQTISPGASTVSVNLSGHFSDPDGDALTYTASSSDTAVATASVSGTTVSVSRVSVTATGTATITVTATDPGGLSATQTFSVTVAVATHAEPQQADAIPGLSHQEHVVLSRLLTYNTLIISKLHNGSVDTNDWLELRNVSAADIALDTWHLTLRTGGTSEVVTFSPGTVVPAGEGRFIVNTPPDLTHPGDAPSASVVAETFVLPQQDFALILRSPTVFGDLVANSTQHGTDRPETVPALTVDTVWSRIHPTLPGYHAKAWLESTHSEGPGTPGYQPAFATAADVNADGVVNILDLVFVANQIGHPAANTLADVNADGVVDVKDLVRVANEF